MSSIGAITPAELERRCGQRDAAGIGRDAVEQAIFLFRCRQVARGARRRSHAATRATAVRNHEWFHLINEHVISMPDKWEYPWFAAWDLAFHTIALATVDLDFAKQQLDLLLQQALPASERPAAGLRMELQRRQSARAGLGGDLPLRSEQALRGKGDRDFLEAGLHQAAAQFHLVGEPQGPLGRSVFEGGFLGLDNIGVFDRSAPLPTGGIWSRRTARPGWRCSARTCCEIAIELRRRTIDLRGLGDQVRRAFPADRRRDEQPRAARACGTRRTDFSTTSCACPTARPRG